VDACRRENGERLKVDTGDTRFASSVTFRISTTLSDPSKALYRRGVVSTLRLGAACECPRVDRSAADVARAV
jgi:hypothetical protein